MYNRLNPGGRMVTLVSRHYIFSSHKKEKEFKNWLEKNNAMISDLKDEIGEECFKESGTMITPLLLVIDR